jgi:hypothetical protein
VPALDRLRGVRVVADSTSLDRATWAGDDVTVLRFAPDDAFGVAATGVDIDYEHAIVQDEVGFVGAWLDPAVVEPHLEWSLPTARPALAQGSIAGVPAKLWLPADGDALLLTAAAYGDELSRRLGSRR